MQEQSEPPAFGKPMWLLWSWCRGDALPICESVSGLTVEESKHVELLSHLMGIPEAALREQLGLGHRAYLTRLETLPVAVGWSATGEVAMFGGRVTLHVPPNNRYLYGFVTHPAWRGRGIYPHLLQAILRTEEQEHFWIIHLIENTSSQRGIHKAGFRVAGRLSFFPTGGFGLIAPPEDSERAQLAQHLLGLPPIGETQDT
ncbi:MAG TPA: GNAT family N-acetyltransferase [Ktedonobacteraceae bacterium]|nr:GNAT family N-acetyltransferase [Ktedonobacteraceae bacterium]